MRKFSSQDLGCLPDSDAEQYAEARLKLNSLLDDLAKYSSELEGSEAFSQAMKYLKQAFSSGPGDFFRCLLAALLKGVQGLSKLLLSTSKILITLLFDAFKSMFEILVRMITTKMNIPFFSSLYKLISGSDLTILDLCSLILALPATLATKCITNKAPFKDETEIRDLVEEVRCCIENMKIVTGIKTGHMTIPANSQDYYHSKGMRKVFTMINAVSGWLYCWIGGFADATSSENEVLSASAIFVEICWLVTSCPVVYAVVEKGKKEYEAIEWYEWFGFGVFSVGFLLDLGVTLADKGVWIDKNHAKLTGFYGLIHMAALLISAIKDFDGASFASELSGSVSEISKFIIDYPLGRSVVVFLDFVAGVIIMGTGLLSFGEIDDDSVGLELTGSEFSQMILMST